MGGIDLSAEYTERLIRAQLAAIKQGG